MKVYELLTDDEYPFQISLGLFMSVEAARKDIDIDLEILHEEERDGDLIIYCIDHSNYSNPKKEEFPIIFNKYKQDVSSFSFYGLAHKGFVRFGIFAREVK